MSKKEYILLYLALCLVGSTLEWGFGTFWSVVGTTPWVYPDSLFHFTSWAVLPTWGLGGLVGVSVYRALVHRKARLLLSAIPPLVLSALWILFYSWLTV